MNEHAATPNNNARIRLVVDGVERLRSDEFTLETAVGILEILRRELRPRTGSTEYSVPGRAISADSTQSEDGGADGEGTPPSDEGPAGRAASKDAIQVQAYMKWADRNTSSSDTEPPDSCGPSGDGGASSSDGDSSSEESEGCDDDPAEPPEKGKACTRIRIRTGRPRPCGPEPAGVPGDSPPAPTPTARPVTAYRPEDVLFGRGGLSNHHVGNKRYRDEVRKLRPAYTVEGMTKRQKTEIRNKLVDTVLGYGGRFLEHDERSGGWVEAELRKARRKASQALREAGKI